MVEFKEEKWTKQPKLVLWGGEYEGDGRAYVDPSDNSRHPSVTSILKYTPKKDMMGWSAEKVAERARDRPDIVMGDPEKVVSRLQYAYNDYRDERGWVGTGVHAAIQADHEQTWDFPELDEEQQSMMARFAEFAEDYKLEIELCEVTVLIEPLGVMGTFDALGKITDPITGEVIPCLLDWKTSRKLWAEHRMQVSALRAATHVFTEVPEGTSGAHLRKGKVKAQNSWWTKKEVAWNVAPVLVHIREDKYDVEVLTEQESEFYYRMYEKYAGIHMLHQEAKGLGIEL